LSVCLVTFQQLLCDLFTTFLMANTDERRGFKG
jgi:hypothetical protein